MTTNKYLKFRGDIRAVASLGTSLAFVTQHPDGIPTALYRVDVATLELQEMPLPCGGLCLASTATDMWLGGDDGKIYRVGAKSKKPTALKTTLPAAPTTLRLAADGRLIVTCQNQLFILDAKGATLQSFELDEKGTSLAVDPTGKWLAVGMAKGRVSVFECEESDEFQVSETEKLHEGAVTALLFEPEELRFFSAGADQKLLLTHARGKLEPEDRGRGASHSDHVTALVHAPGERFLSVSRDKTAKSWARAGATRPATLDESMTAAVDATIVEIHERPHLVVAGDDNAFRFILLDAGGRFSSLTQRLYDAYQRAAHFLKDQEVSRRGEALHELAGYDDSRSLEIIAAQISEDTDHGLRLKATELIAHSSHPRAVGLLEPLLRHKDEKVRLQAFAGLQRAAESGDLRPLELAISSGQANVGIAAVETLQPLAKKDESAKELLIQTIDRNPDEVRRAALAHLEHVFPSDSPEAVLLAAKAGKSDIRRLALIRGFQRELLTMSRVERMVRRSGEDKDADVRRTAFLVSLLSRSKLSTAVRQRDEEIHRQLFELENTQLSPAKEKSASKKGPPKLKAAKFTLDSEDYAPLLSAMASHMPDTCLLGARCLALLGDSRALGTLLQLSREEDDAARVEVCRALAALQDSRASQRLVTMIDDSATEVRDAAYSALESIYSKTPLESAEVGLRSSFVDVRRRALQTLAKSLRSAKAKSISSDAKSMLLFALNDSETSVSGEAFKIVLGLKKFGDAPDATLRFALSSARTNVRREVLTETMAQEKEPWASVLLFEFLDDPSPKIRDDAFEQLTQKSKGRDVEIIQKALASRHADIRLRATKGLIRINNQQAHDALAKVLDDDDTETRTSALSALIEVNDADVLRNAMSSRYADVRLLAATMRAMFHDEAATVPLVAAVTAPRPEKEDEVADWEKNVLRALFGIATLGSPDSVPILIPLLENKVAGIRQRAAVGLTRCLREEHVEQVQDQLQHEDPQVRFRVGLALALCRQSIALPVVFGSDAQKVLNDDDLLTAAVAFGPALESHVVAMLESESEWIRNAAFLVLLFRDWLDHDGTPTRILSVISTRDARIRLAAARALESFSDADKLAATILEIVNARGDEEAWHIGLDQLTEVARLIVFAEPHCQAHVVKSLESLAAEKQDEWEFAWHVSSQRYADQLKTLADQADKKKLPKLSGVPAEASSLAFGTYVGLLREQGGYHARGVRPAFGSSIIGVRQSAIRRLLALAAGDEDYLSAVRPVLVQSLGDNLAAVRDLAFAKLADAGVDPSTRAAAAIDCGHTDLAVAGLRLLTESPGNEGRDLVEDIIATRDDDLAAEAARLLRELTDTVTAAKLALDSPNKLARSLAIGWLAEAYEDDKKAAKALWDAYQKNRHPTVRRSAALTLAAKKHDRAFQMLIDELASSAPGKKQLQQSMLDGLQQLGDSRTPAALLDVLEADAEKVLERKPIFAVIGSFRSVDIVDRLVELMEKSDLQTLAAKSVVQISGYDQRCLDPRDERTNRDWLDEQFPRHDDVLAKFFEKCIELNLPALISPEIPAARWSLSGAVDKVLPLLASHPEDRLREAVVEAIGWRCRKRGGPADTLRTLLQHRDATTKFIAAEGLARAGKSDGIVVLLSAVELMSDLNLRNRAVRALGELADEQALDVLLKLADDDGHALQPVAAEAIGHMGQSQQADKVFELLQKLANANESVARRAIVGLRWLNTPSAWELIREQASEGRSYQYILLKQLGHNDDPATRTLLLEVLKSAHAGYALPSARLLFGEDSLEPDYAALQTENHYQAEGDLERQFHCLERVCEKGLPERIMEILPHTACRDELFGALLHRAPPPVEAAAAALDNPHAVVVEMSAAILGRGENQDSVKQLGQTLLTWRQKWTDFYDQGRVSGATRYEDLRSANAALCRLAWAIGQTGAGKKELLEVLAQNSDLGDFQAVRHAAVAAIANGKLTKKEVTALAPLTNDPDPFVRQVAADILARNNAADQVTDAFADRDVFRQLVRHNSIDTSTVADGADHAHYQSIVLPELVAGKAVAKLAEVAGNQQLDERVRFGAVEGLARMGDQSADEQLVLIGQNKESGEELQRAAWRGLRRSKRLQAQRES